MTVSPSRAAALKDRGDAAPASSPPVLGITARAVLLGLALSFGVGAVVPFISLHMLASNASAYFTSQIALFALFVLILFVNVVLGKLRVSWVFHRGELVILFIMMALANSVPGLVAYWVPLVSSPFYYASAENDWAEMIHPYIPDWLVPRDPAAIQAFFEGSTGGASQIPWDVWIGPLLAWAPLVIALQVVMICMMVILRRQWVEKERLIYPVMQLPLAMVRDDDRGSLLKPFFRNPVMWIGFSMPVLLLSVNGLSAYFPFIPSLSFSIPFPLFSSRFSFATLGFFFLIQTEVSLGLWVFTLLNELQQLIYTEIGWGIDQEPAVSVWSYGLHSLVHQGMGASIVLVLGGFWVGREHIMRVFRKAFAGAPDVDDGDEIMSYRAAVLGLILGMAVLVYWMTAAGIPLAGTLVVLFFAFVVYITLTRVIVEGGVAVIYAPLVSADAALSAAGTALYGPSGLVGLGFVRIFANDLLNFTMPHVANGLKLGDQVEVRRRLLFWCMLLAILVGIAGSMWSLLQLSYTHGAVNLRPPHFVWLPNYVGDYITARMKSPTGPDMMGWLHTGIGSAVMGGLLMARRYWSWWPLHPIGFPISSAFNWMAFNAFLAWAIKAPVLRYGGVGLYMRLRPLFLGMILGQFATYGLFWILDAATGMIGNYLPV